MAIPQLKTLTIEQALANRSTTLYVVNNFSDRNQRTADIVGEYRDTNSSGANAQPFKIPVSWIPQRLSDIAPKEFFLEGSPDFMNAVRRQWLVIVDPKQAEAFLNESPEAQVEADRITLVIQGNQIGVDSLLRKEEGETVIDLNRVRNRGQNTQQRTSELIASGPVDDQPQNSKDTGISPQVMNVMQRPDNEVSAVAKLNSLKSITNLSKQDLEYIHMNTSDTNTLAWIKEASTAADEAV